MSIRGMVDDLVNRQRFREVKNNPAERAKIRKACQAVLDAKTDVEEFNAIIKLGRLIPKA